MMINNQTTIKMNMMGKFPEIAAMSDLADVRWGIAQLTDGIRYKMFTPEFETEAKDRIECLKSRLVQLQSAR